MESTEQERKEVANRLQNALRKLYESVTIIGKELPSGRLCLADPEHFINVLSQIIVITREYCSITENKQAVQIHNDLVWIRDEDINCVDISKMDIYDAHHRMMSIYKDIERTLTPIIS